MVNDSVGNKSPEDASCQRACGGSFFALDNEHFILAYKSRGEERSGRQETDERHLPGTCFCTWESPTLVSQTVQVTPRGGGMGACWKATHWLPHYYLQCHLSQKALIILWGEKKTPHVLQADGRGFNSRCATSSLRKLENSTSLTLSFVLFCF